MPKARVAAPAPAVQAASIGVPVSAGPKFASLDPDSFVSTGLANNFNGRILSVWHVPRVYKVGKRKGTYSCFLRLEIKADDESLGHDGVVTEFYREAALNQWVPTRSDAVLQGDRWVYTPTGAPTTMVTIDGVAREMNSYLALHQGLSGFPPDDPVNHPKEPGVIAPQDWWGWRLCPGPEHSQEGLPKGTKADQFLSELKKLGYKAKAPHIDHTDARQWLVGVYGHFVRIPFEWKGTRPPLEEGQTQQSNDTLCLVEILDLGPISGAQGGAPVAAAPVAVAAAPAIATPQTALLHGPTNAEPLGATINSILTTMVNQRGPAGLLKSEIGAPVYDQVSKLGMDGAKALTDYINNNAWMEGDDRTFAYDAAKGLLVPLS